MAEPDVVRALRDQQCEVTTRIGRLEQQVVEYRAGLAHPEGVLRLFDPNIRSEEVPAM
jgi:hypothetical protein